MNIYELMQDELKRVATEKGFFDEEIRISCKALTAREAIGDTEHDDYPIHKGKEVMVEATFREAKGQAFTDQYGEGSCTVAELVEMKFLTNKDRAVFISSMNAIWKYLKKAEKTIHCRDQEPVECAVALKNNYDFSKKTLLIGLQPRFLEVLAENGEVRVLDLDKDNIGRTISGIEIEDGVKFTEALGWCEQIFATGSTLCNGTIEGIINSGKPVTFFGVTVAAAAEILKLDTYCECGH